MTFKTNKIDREGVTTPSILFSERAVQEWELIIENDFTLEGKQLRITIDGKECDGFTYAVGFDDKTDEDFEISIEGIDHKLVIDPFAAFYLQVATVDFVQDFSQDAEGFVVVNHSQRHFYGKFWRAHPELKPPLEENQEQ
jgi:Fe-S cluster assembly iron-binding protein IscA